MNKTQEMFSLVESWRASGLSRNTFSEQERITVFKFNYWAAKKRKAELTPGGLQGGILARLDFAYPRVKS